jgi:hypothetical protein
MDLPGVYFPVGLLFAIRPIECPLHGKYIKALPTDHMVEYH